MLYEKTIASPIGKLRLVTSEKGLRYVGFEGDAGKHAALEGEIEPSPNQTFLLKVEAQLAEYFTGTRQKFDVPLDMKGTVFQLNAWRALQKIPHGKTRSYGEQAASMGDARKARAVGMANNRNPIPIIIPCHRVVGHNGALVGYAGGLKRKKYLLELESEK